MLPRIAQLEDRLEKKDKIIVKLRKEYLVLKVKLYYQAYKQFRLLCLCRKL